MKKLSLLLALLASLNALAFDFTGLELNDVLENEAISVITEGKTTIPQDQFSATEPFVNFDYEACSSALYQVQFLDMEGNEYRAIFSNEDQCDGGNTYGFIMDLTSGKVVAQIIDSGIELN